jgi:MerR family transcriptional regulator, light-induced transcriptional regulator
MQQFTIRDIETLTGIKAHTLRIWEQRYDFFRPQRKESLHRVFSNEDLQELLRIAFLYHNGWKISKIAALSPEEVAENVRSLEWQPGRHRQFLLRLLEAAVSFDEQAFLGCMDELTEKIGFEACVTEVCYPFLQRVGLLWSTNNVIPAQEHFSSYLIQNRIIGETERLGAATAPPEIVLLCPQGEHHELPLLFVNYLLRKNGWSTLYLGGNIPKKELIELAPIDGLKTIYLHLITNFTGLGVDDYLEDICRSFRNRQVVASGSGIQSVQRTFVNLRLLRSDAEIHAFIRRDQ